MSIQNYGWWDISLLSTTEGTRRFYLRCIGYDTRFRDAMQDVVALAAVSIFVLPEDVEVWHAQ